MKSVIETADRRVAIADFSHEAVEEVAVDKVIVPEREMTGKFARQVRAMAGRIQAGGDLWPIVVHHRKVSDAGHSKMNELITGEVTLLAYRLLGRRVVPALFIERDSLEARLIDRLVSPLADPFQAARDLEELQTRVNLNDEPLGEMLGMGRGQVVQLRSMLKLPKAIEQEIQSAKLKVSPSALIDIAQGSTAEESLAIWRNAVAASQGRKITRELARAVIARHKGVPNDKCRPTIVKFAKFLDSVVAGKTAINAVEEAELSRIVSHLSTKLAPALAQTLAECPPADT